MPKRSPAPEGLGASLRRAYDALQQMNEAIKGIHQAVMQQAQELTNGLESEVPSGSTPKGRPRAPKSAPEKAPSKTGRISAKQKRARAFQGKYLNAVRNLSKGERGQVKKVKLEKGGDAALALATQLQQKA